MYLATTALTEFWNKDEPILFLGGWCLKYSERQAWESLTYQVLEYPWNDHERLSNAITYCDGVYESLLETLAEYMNNVHRVNYGKRYWRIILGPWLLHYTHALYDRYICLQMALQRFPNFSTITLEEKCFVTPHDFFDYLTRCNDDPYNLQLYSQILSCIDLSFPSKPLLVSMKKAYDNKRRIKIFLKKIYGRFLSLCSPSHPILLFDMHFKQSDVWRLCLNTGFKAWPMTYEGKYESGIENLPVDSTVRRDLVSLQNSFENDLFTQVLCRTLPVNLPICYLEGYSRIRSFAHKFFKGNARGIASSFGWTSNENFKFFAAESSENGSFLYSIQHGGASGVNKYTAGDIHMMKSSDVYFTWGWTDRNLKHAKPMPDPDIQRLRKCSYSAPSLDNAMLALFVGTIFPRYLQYLRYCPLGPQVEKYISWQIRFLKMLPYNIRNRFKIRLYSQDFGWSNQSRLSEQISGLKFDDHTLPYREQVKKSKLIVADNCQTTFFETLLLNRPVILFYDPSLWKVSPAAMQCLELLHQVGVVHYSPEDAAEKVAKDFEQLDLWWYSESVQMARWEYINRFTICNNDWLAAWKKEFLTIHQRIKAKIC